MTVYNLQYFRTEWERCLGLYGSITTKAMKHIHKIVNENATYTCEVFSGKSVYVTADDEYFYLADNCMIMDITEYQKNFELKVKNYLRNNLRINLSTDSDYYSSNSVRVNLTLDGEEISSDCVSLPSTKSAY